MRGKRKLSETRRGRLQGAGKKSKIRRTAQGLELPGVDLERMVAEVCRGQKKEQKSTYCAGVGVENETSRIWRGIRNLEG